MGSAPGFSLKTVRLRAQEGLESFSNQGRMQRCRRPRQVGIPLVGLHQPVHSVQNVKGTVVATGLMA